MEATPVASAKKHSNKYGQALIRYVLLTVVALIMLYQLFGWLERPSKRTQRFSHQSASFLQRLISKHILMVGTPRAVYVHLVFYQYL